MSASPGSILEAVRSRVGDAVRVELLDAAVQAATEAGALQLASLGGLRDEAIRRKSSIRDLVTEVDLACERRIVEHLRGADGSVAIEAEEETSDAVRGGLRWFVDPLDGTLNYVHELPMFCVSIALYDGEEPLLGIVHAPRIGETFFAARGAGAYVLDRGLGAGDDPKPRRLQVADPEHLHDAILATGFPYRRGELKHSNLENFGRFFYDVRGMRRMGSAALDLAYVAAGRQTGYWELHLSPFDLAAGALLVREAGGVVTDPEGGQGWLRSGAIVASGPLLAGEIRGRIEYDRSER